MLIVESKDERGNSVNSSVATEQSDIEKLALTVPDSLCWWHALPSDMLAEFCEIMARHDPTQDQYDVIIANIISGDWKERFLELSEKIAQIDFDEEEKPRSKLSHKQLTNLTQAERAEYARSRNRGSNAHSRSAQRR